MKKLNIVLILGAISIGLIAASIYAALNFHNAIPEETSLPDPGQAPANPSWDTPLTYNRAGKTLVVPDDYQTINEAIANASDEDTVLVRQGTYSENVVIDKSLTIKGENSNTTIVGLYDYMPTIFITGNNVEVTGLKVANMLNPKPVSDSLWRMAAIHLLHANNASIHENNVTNSGKGVWIYGGSGNHIWSNNFSRNNYGIVVEASTNNTVMGNSASNGWGGIWLESSSGTILKNNTMFSNTANFGVDGADLRSFYNYVDTSNTVDGKKIYYLLNRRSLLIDPDSYPNLGSLILVNSVNVAVRNLNVSNNFGAIHIVGVANSTVIGNAVSNSIGGIWIQFSNNSIFSENTIELNYSWGDNDNYDLPRGSIRLESSSNITISKNVIVNNQTWYGLELKNSSRNLVQSNTIASGGGGIYIWDESNFNILSENKIAPKNHYYGIGIDLRSASSNVLVRNELNNLYRGLSILVSSNNTFTENTITSTYRAADFHKSSGNLFYRNNFMNVTIIYDAEIMYTRNITSMNRWDNGSIGNYWSDYLIKYPKATGIGDTGTGNTPYVIDAGNTDSHPLIVPF